MLPERVFLLWLIMHSCLAERASICVACVSGVFDRPFLLSAAGACVSAFVERVHESG